MESLGRKISKSSPLFGEVMKLIFSIIFQINLIFSSDQIPAPDQDHPILIKGATLHTVSHGTLENAEIIFDKGIDKNKWSNIGNMVKITNNKITFFLMFNQSRYNRTFITIQVLHQ